MTEATTEIPNTPEVIVAELVLHLPGYLFFIENVDLPEGLESNEIADFAELTVESIAPFPLEQLHWGFLHSADSTSILVYAAHQNRLKKYGIENIDAYAWVLPDFASLYGAHFPEATEVTLVSEEAVTLVQFKSGAEIPYAVASHPANNADHNQIVQSLRDELDESADFPRKLELQLTKAPVNEQGLASFHFAEVGTDNGRDYGHWSELSSNEKTLWQADIRLGDFKESERSSRRTSALLTKVMAWSLLFALLLIGLEIIILAGNTWLGSRVEKIASQKPAIARIEDKQALMDKLEQVAQNELRPIAILEALNKSRPTGIHFTSTDTEDENLITVDGEATTINELNKYIETLSKSGIFSLTEPLKSLTRGGKTTFTAKLKYTHPEEPADNLSSKPDDTPDSEPAAKDVAEAKPEVKAATETIAKTKPTADTPKPRRIQAVDPGTSPADDKKESKE
ncbi:MAG: PilN domain-containing protein [Opitutaceae bacterium]